MRLALILLLAVSATAQPAKRALLIGIDDYTASSLPVVGPKQHRGWPDLQGAANDVRILSELLVLRYGFERKNVVTLTNQQATRAAILLAIEQHLVHPARKGDIVFYYFAGHGAQVPNAASDEPDRRDESIVPADSRRGAADIRDKELRPLFNRILDRGAKLTLLLDHCHSGGGFRARPRGIAPAPPMLDERDYGPRPDERGALALVSTQDLDPAWEISGDDGLMHGAFTWAWIQAMRNAATGEAAQETFLRAQAWLRGKRGDQSPAMLGRSEARLRPFLGDGLRPSRIVVAVENVEPNGDIILQGGWAHGFAPGSELISIDGHARLRITQILGIGRSIARTDSVPPRPGALLAAPHRNNGWLSLSDTASPYHLAIRDEGTQQLVRDTTLIGNRIYSIVLRAAEEKPAPRYYYVFAIDSRGKSRLLFPTTGSVENRFPIEASADIALGTLSAFRIDPPYGTEMFVLLSTEEALPNPSILEWDGVRGHLPTRWSIERITFESAAPPTDPHRRRQSRPAARASAAASRRLPAVPQRRAACGSRRVCASPAHPSDCARSRDCD